MDHVHGPRAWTTWNPGDDVLVFYKIRKRRAQQKSGVDQEVVGVRKAVTSSRKV
jgi:hypothetical protein